MVLLVRGVGRCGLRRSGARVVGGLFLIVRLPFRLASSSRLFMLTPKARGVSSNRRADIPRTKSPRRYGAGFLLGVFRHDVIRGVS